jgi:hypothetical protein
MPLNQWLACRHGRRPVRCRVRSTPCNRAGQPSVKTRLPHNVKSRQGRSRDPSRTRPPHRSRRPQRCVQSRQLLRPRRRRPHPPRRRPCASQRSLRISPRTVRHLRMPRRQSWRRLCLPARSSAVAGVVLLALVPLLEGVGVVGGARDSLVALRRRPRCRQRQCAGASSQMGVSSGRSPMARRGKRSRSIRGGTSSPVGRHRLWSAGSLGREASWFELPMGCALNSWHFRRQLI